MCVCVQCATATRGVLCHYASYVPSRPSLQHNNIDVVVALLSPELLELDEKMPVCACVLLRSTTIYDTKRDDAVHRRGDHQVSQQALKSVKSNDNDNDDDERIINKRRTLRAYVWRYLPLSRYHPLYLFDEIATQ